jgi:hypothetical protein
MFNLIAPLGTIDTVPHFQGRCLRKPWDYPITAAIPHLDTIEPLRMCIDLLRAQTMRPYIMVIDTGSPPSVLAELEELRAEDVEIHRVAAHAYRHASEPVTVAMDVAQALCRSERLFHTHSDCFLRRHNFLEDISKLCGPQAPVVGYRLSPRNWVTEEWEWMIGHTATMCFMPIIHRVGATWSFQRTHYDFGVPWDLGPGWPDTETGFNYALRDAGIRPVFIGYDINFERQIDDNIDHVRSFPGSKMSDHNYHSKAKVWMKEALREGHERLRVAFPAS